MFAYAGIETISLSDSLNEIPYAAFFECDRLKTIEIPNSVTSIGISAFSGCRKLETVTLSTSLSKISDSVFSDCRSLKHIKLPEGIVSIGKMVFSYNLSLETVELPNSLVSIDSGAFSNCRALSSIILPQSIKTIGSEAFAGCSSLLQISIPEGVNKISDYLFCDCTFLSKVVLPKSTQIIREEAFCKCSSLSELYCQAQTPPECDIYAFEFVPSFTIYVPWQSIAEYKNADVWSNYADNIKVDPIVDLGLSVKWAAFNLGADTPEGFGEYYAWGETEPFCAGETYKWRNQYGLTKYCQTSKYRQWGLQSDPDNKTELDPEDDAAFVNLGEKWRTPKKEEWEELYNQCTWSWVTINGVGGYLVESKMEANDNSIFLPAAGVFTTSVESPAAVGEIGGYLSSTLTSDPSTASSLYFIYHEDAPSYQNYLFPDCGNFPRTYGQTVRAVYE